MQLLSHLTYPALHPELYLGCFEEAGDARMGQCKAPKGRWADVAKPSPPTALPPARFKGAGPLRKAKPSKAPFAYNPPALQTEWPLFLFPEKRIPPKPLNLQMALLVGALQTIPGGGEVSAAALGLPGMRASGRGRESGPYNEEGPGLDLLDLPLQVLPGDQALHVDVQLVPSAEQLLVHLLQPKGTWEEEVRADAASLQAGWVKGEKARLGAPAWPQSWGRKWGQWGAMAC